MDDDLEDELMYELLLAHVRIVSKGLTGLQDGVVRTSRLGSYLSYVLFQPETLILVACVCVGVFLMQSLDLWTKNFVNKVKAWTNISPPVNKKVEPPVVKKLPEPEEEEVVEWEEKLDDVGVYAMQGRRGRMEDRYLVVDRLANLDLTLLAVFDGHGGEFAPEFVKNALLRNLKDRLSSLDRRLPSYCEDVAGATPSVGALKIILREEILKADHEVLEASKKKGNVSGTTAIVALIERKSNQLLVANVGDSRGVMADHKGNVIPLSYDHKPQLQKEEKRIKDAGGFVSLNNGVWRVCGILATSRALGDYPLKDRALITSMPDILTFDLTNHKPQFLLLASDGLWDVLTNEDAIRFASTRLKEDCHGAKAVTQRAFNLGSADNISVIIMNTSKWNWKSTRSERSDSFRENMRTSIRKPKVETEKSSEKKDNPEEKKKTENNGEKGASETKKTTSETEATKPEE